jgi:hypothetical protein
LPELVEWARASQNAPALAVVLVRRGQVAESGAVGRRSANNPISVTTGDRWQTALENLMARRLMASP